MTTQLKQLRLLIEMANLLKDIGEPIEVYSTQCFYHDPTLHTEGEVHIKEFAEPKEMNSVLTPILDPEKLLLDLQTKAVENSKEINEEQSKKLAEIIARFVNLVELEKLEEITTL